VRPGSARADIRGADERVDRDRCSDALADADADADPYRDPDI
jgi:hypothetical protein